MYIWIAAFSRISLLEYVQDVPLGVVLNVRLEKAPLVNDCQPVAWEHTLNSTVRHEFHAVEGLVPPPDQVMHKRAISAMDCYALLVQGQIQMTALRVPQMPFPIRRRPENVTQQRFNPLLQHV